MDISDTRADTPSGWYGKKEFRFYAPEWDSDHSTCCWISCFLLSILECPLIQTMTTEVVPLECYVCIAHRLETWESVRRNERMKLEKGKDFRLDETSYNLSVSRHGRDRDILMANFKKLKSQVIMNAMIVYDEIHLTLSKTGHICLCGYMCLRSPSTILWL